MTLVYVIHARLRSQDGFVGMRQNRCDHCGKQMFGTKKGQRWRYLMGHPWHHDGAALWCVTCLEDAGYEVKRACTHEDVIG